MYKISTNVASNRVKKIEDNGFIRVERVGGIPEKALASQDIVIVNNKNELVSGIIGNKSHHATQPDEKYTVTLIKNIYIFLILCLFYSICSPLSAIGIS